MTEKPISFLGAVSLGVGTMIGAGIFALLGEAGALAGSAVWISFVVGGFIALLSGYSLGRLGARYPSAGGIIEYLIHGYGDNLFAGAVSILMYLSAIVSLSLVAKAFGSYGAALIGGGPHWLPRALAVSVVWALVIVNLRGAAAVARVELAIVVLKSAVLLLLAAGGLFLLDPDLLAPSRYPATESIVASVAVTFFAYEGFRVVTNAAEDVRDPQKTIPRAILVAVVFVMGLYVLLAVAVFGTLPTADVIAARDSALAAAAKPIFGQVGFTIVAVTALIATASAINASLYAVTNTTYLMAKDGELPGVFGQPLEKSREGLIVSAVAISLLAFSFDLGQIAMIGALSILTVHATVHIGHLRITRATKANRLIVAGAALCSVGAVALSLRDSVQKTPVVAISFAILIAIAVLLEAALRRFGARKLRARLPSSSLGDNRVM